MRERLRSTLRSAINRITSKCYTLYGYITFGLNVEYKENNVAQDENKLGEVSELDALQGRSATMTT